MVRDLRRTLRSALWVGTCAVSLAGCRQLTLDNPDPPNTAGLQAVYDSPPGELTAPDLSSVADGFEERTALLRGTNDFSLAQELLETISSDEDVVKKGEQLDPTAGARLLAVIKVHRICRGPATEPDEELDEDKYGSIDMTIKASPRGVFPIVWGRFNQCADRSASGDFTLDGPYSVTSRHEKSGVGLLFQFDGTIQSDDIDFEGRLDFRIRGDKTKELRVKAANGDVVVALSAMGHLVVRDRASEWECDPTAIECTELKTGAVLSAERAP